ncbi:MAG: molybdate ABC transporter permease subunit [Rhodospirillaceae bacterium]
MDWTALSLSLNLAAVTCAALIPLAMVIGRWLAWTRIRWKGWAEALIALPLILPPTVLGYYFLVAFGNASPIGQAWQSMFGSGLVFTFEALVVASIIFNLPFAVQPVQRAFEAIPDDVREAAWCSGLSNLATLRRIELPLAWPGIVSAVALTFAHTLGEFGVVLMVGGNIPGETRTLSLAIYDSMQSFDDRSAGVMSLFLLALSFVAIALVYGLARRGQGRTHG